MAFNKYGAEKTRHAGRSFDSKGESQCFEYLKLLERQGEITDLRAQVSVKLVAGIAYRADFKFFDVALGEDVWGEYKGFETPEWLLKLKLWRVFGPGRLRIFRGHYPRFHIEEVVPEGTTQVCSVCAANMDKGSR